MTHTRDRAGKKPWKNLITSQNIAQVIKISRNVANVVVLMYSPQMFLFSFACRILRTPSVLLRSEQICTMHFFQNEISIMKRI